MNIRNSTLEDISEMMEIFSDAREKMHASGNHRQWRDDYPSFELLRRDIQKGTSHIVEQNGRIVATFVLAEGEDPTYRRIYCGSWIDDRRQYVTIHRIASRKGVHGIMNCVLDWSFQRFSNIRIDTHRDNAVMRHLLEKSGFHFCGIILLANGDERLAFQKLSL